jgi:hypothetical protein
MLYPQTLQMNIQLQETVDGHTYVCNIRIFNKWLCQYVPFKKISNIG